MKIFYDCEFIEDGRTIDLISIGMVADDGRELYLVNEAITEEPLYDRIRDHEWLMVNVVPHLPLRSRYNGMPSIDQPGPANVYPRKHGLFHLDMGDNRIVPLRFIRNAVRDFIAASGADIELWAWYGAYDHVALAQLFGPMINLPEGVPMWTNDLRQEVRRRGIDLAELPRQTIGEHNALEDARHLRIMSRYVNGRDS